MVSKTTSRLLQDPDLALALLHNVQYALGTVTCKIVISLSLALLINQPLRGRVIFRTAVFMPVVMSFVVIGMLWTRLYGYSYGVINELLRSLGLAFLVRDWLGNPQTALGALIVVDTWKWYGFHMVIFLAGLQTIPLDLYEAAVVDGASRWNQFWKITLPLLRPAMIVNLTLALMGGFSVFDVPFVMTDGGPIKSTLVVSLLSYHQAFRFYQFGAASATSIFLMVVVMAVGAPLLRLQGRDD